MRIINTQIRDIVTSLIDDNYAKLAYYNHEPLYSHLNVIEDTVPGYDGNDDFYKQYEPVLVMFGHGDYVGNDVDMSNMRYVERNYDDLFENGTIAYNNGGYGYTELVIFFLRPSVVRSGLFDDLEELDGHPILDDDINNEIQEEMLQEAWESWGRYDFERKIEKLTGYEFSETNWQDGLFWETLHYGSGSEYYPEGTSMYIDFNEVLGDDTIIETITENAKDLDTGEFEVLGDYRKIGHRLGINPHYNGSMNHSHRLYLLDLNKHQKYGHIPEWLLDSAGLKWYDDHAMFWVTKPINEKVKECLANEPIDLIHLRLKKTGYDFCENCHSTAVCHVLTKMGFLNYQQALYTFCGDCYNLLMNYWHKCEHCKVKNANVSLQTAILPNAPFTHCEDCKNVLTSL